MPARFRASLTEAPVTFSEPLKKHLPASRALAQNPRRALPQIKLTTGAKDGEWFPRRDLLSSNGDDRNFVAEIDNDGVARLRFGDGDCGRMPEAETVFTAAYRVGNGLAGNVGAETISRIVFDKTKFDGLSVRNPLAAHGGVAAEPVVEVKLFAPRAFRRELLRAITADDYAAIVMRDFPEAVQRAGAELRWTGSWHEARVAIDPRGPEEADPLLLREIERHLRPYQRIGHDVRVVQARYVPLSIVFTICIRPHFLRGHVEAALRDAFAAGPRANGAPGFFHPDKLTFGSGIYLSQLVAAAQAIEGVESVQVTTLQRLFEAPNHEIENGVLPLGGLEVAQLDNDLRAPDRGQLKFNLKGGR
jgi:predicted phage baseplate assembly protein